MNYQTIEPEAKQDSYNEYDIVDFSMTFENLKLLCNTIRFEGGLDVKKGGNPIANGDNVFLDPSIGVHSLIQSITVYFQNKGEMENFADYSRYVRMVADATKCSDDMYNSSNVCEMRAPNPTSMENLLVPIEPRGLDLATNNAQPVLPDFSFKPVFLLNNASSDDGDTSLSYKKSGAIKVSVVLGRNNDVIYGAGNNSDCTYSISNFRMSYMTKPEDGKDNKLILKSHLSFTQSIQSGLANISTKPPAICNSVSCSFIKQSNQHQGNQNNNETEVVPGLEQVVFTFNDSTNQFVSFPMEDRPEIMERYVDSLKSQGVNDASLTRVEANRGFGIGLDFGEYINFANQKFNIQLSSAITNATPYVIYMYFSSVKSV